MFRKLAGVLFSVFLLVNMSGCVALLAGAAGGAGTAVWLSGKLTQEVNAPFQRSLNATKTALKSLRLKITKETIKEDVAQVMSNYTDGRTIWIDIHRIPDLRSRIEIRVGAVGDKEAALKILTRIMKYL